MGSSRKIVVDCCRLLIVKASHLPWAKENDGAATVKIHHLDLLQVQTHTFKDATVKTGRTPARLNVCHLGGLPIDDWMVGALTTGYAERWRGPFEETVNEIE